MSAPDALATLIGRHSLGIKHLGEPGPDDAALAWMAEAALHAPDHAELVLDAHAEHSRGAEAAAAKALLAVLQGCAKA